MLKNLGSEVRSAEAETLLCYFPTFGLCKSLRPLCPQLAHLWETELTGL